MTSKFRIAGSTGLLRTSPSVGPPTSEPREWTRQLKVLRHHGFEFVDVSEIWMPIHGLALDVRRALADSIDTAGLTATGISLLGGTRLLDVGSQTHEIHRMCSAMDLAVDLGARHVSYAIRDPRNAPIDEVSVGPRSPSGRIPRPLPMSEVYKQNLASSVKALAQEARARDLTLAIEMNELALDRSPDVLDLLDRVGEDNVGVNPDLGNMLRAWWPLDEDWWTTIEQLASRITYWHVKNGVRIELPDGTAVFHPSSMESGTVDYRYAFALAFAKGFRGDIVVEHYGNDSLKVAENNKKYIDSLLSDLLEP